MANILLSSPVVYRQTAGKYIFRTLGHESNIGNAPQQFVQNTSQDVLIITSGNVGIGSGSPRSQLDVVGSAICSQNIGIGTTTTTVSFEVWHSNAMLLPRGSTSARPDGPLQGYMRYNTDTNVFEGFGAGNVWGSLGGVKSTDQLTFISAEEFAGANDANIRFFTGGAQQMLLDPEGNLGIGTAMPREKLHVEGNIYANGTVIASNMQIIGDFVTLNTVTSNTEQIVVSNDGTGPAIKVSQTGASSIAEFYDDGALALIVADGGRVGINTSAPVVSLDIRTTDAVLLPRGATNERPQEVQQGYIRYNTETFQFEGLGAANQWGSLGGVKSTDQFTFISAEEYAGANDSNLRFVTGLQQHMIIDAVGNVGIGTVAPRTKLDVMGPVRVTQMDEGGNAIAEFYRSNGAIAVAVAESGFVGIGTQIPVADLHVVGAAVFDGRVGMNTGVPRNDLDIVGTAIISQNIGIGTTTTAVSFEVWHSNAMLLPRGSTSARPDGPLQGYMRYNTDTNVFEGFGAGNVWGSLGGVKSTDQLTFISAEEFAGANDANIRFFTGGAQQMLLDPEGNLGIGTAMPREKLHVEGNIYANGTVIASNMQIIGNFVTLNTVTSNTEQIVVTNNGSGPAIKVTQTGANSIAEFYDDGDTLALIVADGGRIGINTSMPLVSLDIRTTDAVLLPRGSTEQRPQEVQQGYIRYNTETNQFEGLGAASQWGSLGGVKSTDQFTFISAEEYAGANDSNLRFVTGGAQRMIIDYNGRIGVGTDLPLALVHFTSNLGDILRIGDDTVFSSSGNIGIGTHNPMAKFHMGPGAEARIDGNLGIGVTHANARLHIEGLKSEELLRIRSGDDAPSIVVTNGNVGMGTALPAYKLHVEGDTYVNGKTMTSNLVVYDSIEFTNPAQSTNYKKLQVAPIKASVWVDADILASLPIVLTTPGLYTATAQDVDVYRNGNKLYSLNSFVYDYTLTVNHDFSMSNTSFAFEFMEPLAVSDLLNITVWPNYLDNHWAFNIQNITLFTMANAAVIDQTFAAPLQGRPFRFIHKESGVGASNFTYTVDGQYNFDAIHTEVYKNGTKLVFMPMDLAQPIQEYNVAVTYNLYSTNIRLELLNAIDVNDVLDIAFWPIADTAQSNVWDGVVVQNFQNQVVFNGTEGSSPIWYLNGNIGIGTLHPMSLLDVRGDIIANGHIGIGTTTPLLELDVRGDIIATGHIGIGTTTPLLELDVRGDIIATGHIGIGTTSPVSELDVRGNVVIEGHINSLNNLSSDIGSSNMRWRNAYLDVVNLGDTLINRSGSNGIIVQSHEGNVENATVHTMFASNAIIYNDLNVYGTIFADNLVEYIAQGISSSSGVFTSNLLKAEIAITVNVDTNTANRIDSSPHGLLSGDLIYIGNEYRVVFSTTPTAFTIANLQNSAKGTFMPNSTNVIQQNRVMLFDPSKLTCKGSSFVTNSEYTIFTSPLSDIYQIHFTLHFNMSYTSDFARFYIRLTRNNNQTYIRTYMIPPIADNTTLCSASLNGSARLFLEENDIISFESNYELSSINMSYLEIYSS